MYIDKLTQFCDSNYDGHKCKDCQYLCTNNCKVCLEQIHNHQCSIKREYDCPKMISFYVNRFIYRYSSEIQYLFERKGVLFYNLDSFKVLSIGCGPCTELFGLMNFISDNDEYKKKVLYLGVDTNDKWEPVHNKIKRIFINDINIEYIYHKVQKGDLINFSPNIVIMQYLISHIHKDCNRDIDLIHNELDNLLFVADVMDNNSFIIINDINHSLRATDYYNYLFSQILNIYPQSRAKTFHFKNSQRSSYRFFNDNSEEYSATRTTRLPQKTLRLKYDTWEKCKSAQMLIQVRK